MKTDSRDARELCGCLDRYLAGNARALSAVSVPTLEQERRRALSRQRETLAKEKKRLQNIGVSAGTYHGVDLPSEWWKPKIFEGLRQSLPEYMLGVLAPYQAVLEALHRELREATAREERKAARVLPVGLGALTASVLDQEFVDYSRFWYVLGSYPFFGMNMVALEGQCWGGWPHRVSPLRDCCRNRNFANFSLYLEILVQILTIYITFIRRFSSICIWATGG